MYLRVCAKVSVGAGFFGVTGLRLTENQLDGAHASTNAAIPSAISEMPRIAFTLFTILLGRR